VSVLRNCSNLGHAVTVFDNCSEGHRQAVDPRARLIEGDLRDPRIGLFPAVGSTGPEAILHFAANALVGESMENPYKYFHNNVYGGLNLLHAAVEAGTKSFVFSSTCATYGIPERVPIDEEERAKIRLIRTESQKLMFEKIPPLVPANSRDQICCPSLLQRGRSVRAIW